MSERTKEVIIEHIKQIIETRIKPAVASHGGAINFVEFDDGHLKLELSGACSGCSGATMTLQMGVEKIVRTQVPEVESIEAVDDPNSSVRPYM